MIVALVFKIRRDFHFVGSTHKECHKSRFQGFNKESLSYRFHINFIGNIKIPSNLFCLSNSASSASMSFSFSSPPHTLRHGVLDSLFPKKCIEFIQFCQAIKRLLRVMKVERTVRTLWIFKNRKVCEFFLFSSLARNSWKKLSALCHSKNDDV